MERYEQDYEGQDKLYTPEFAFMSTDYSQFKTSVGNKTGIGGFTLDW